MAVSIFVPEDNYMLSSLGPEELEELRPHLHPVTLSLRQVIQGEGAPLNKVYFLQTALASVLTRMLDGAMIEVAMVGPEGMVGVSALLGAETAAHEVIAQIPGAALAVSAGRCRAAFDRSADLRRVVHRFAEKMINQSAQTAACNRLHRIEQRCARWLLMGSDRIRAAEIPMTQEFMSTMLGVRRAGVGEVLGELQRSGLIRYRRGMLTILDRDGLEAVSCECHRADRARLNAFLAGR